MLLAIFLFAPAALAEGAPAEAPAASSQNSSAAAVAVQDGIPAPVAEQPLPQNETGVGVDNPDTVLKEDSSVTSAVSQPPSAVSQPPSAVATTPGQPAVAGQEPGGGEQPDYELHLVCSAGEKGTYWDSRDDYNARLLSIDYSLSNVGTGTAYDVRVTEAVANRGVTVATPLPVLLGDIGPGALVYFTLKWLVPSNVGSFTTDITACADSKDDENGGDDDGGDDDGGDDDGGDDEDDEDGNEEDLNGDKPPGDGGQLNYPPDNAADGSIGNRTSQNNLSQYSIVRSALPSTGFAGLNAAVFMIALLACGALLALLVTAKGNRRRQ